MHILTDNELTILMLFAYVCGIIYGYVLWKVSGHD